MKQKVKHQKKVLQKLSNKYFVTKTLVNNPMCHRSTVAQMAEQAPRDRKVPSSNPALDPMRRVSKYNPY